MAMLAPVGSRLIRCPNPAESHPIPPHPVPCAVCGHPHEHTPIKPYSPFAGSIAKQALSQLSYGPVVLQV
jgi:hypothetical protein